MSTAQRDRLGFRGVFEEIGHVSTLLGQTLRTLFTTRLELSAFTYQVEQMGVRSLAIGSATAIFVGIVMAIQFAFALERYGAKETIGRIVGLSEVRELAPSLTALVVGCRIGAGIAAELGSMAVTEQIDAIRALGADPVRKLVVPRLLAGIIIMPLITCYALLLGVGSACLVSYVSYGVPITFFITSALDAVTMQDYISGVSKTPFFGVLIAILGSYFGINTRGGTEGVGQSTTRSVVVVSTAILIADAVLTQIFLSL